MPSESLLATLLGLLVVALWLGRRRPGFPPDLYYWIKDRSMEEAGVARPVSQGSLLETLFGLVPTTRIRIRGEDRVLATLCPVNDGLYRLRPRKGVGLRRAQSDRSPLGGRGSETVAVEIEYALTLEGSDRELVFRLGYRPP
jgi:hypothetical protein